MESDILSEKQVLEQCNKIYPDEFMQITARELKTWTYCKAVRTVACKNGTVYSYPSRKFIPENLKVEGKRAFYPGIVKVVLRIRELQLLNLDPEAIMEVIKIEYKTGKRAALCRDCGANLGYLIDDEEECLSVCDDCADTVVYNHKE